MVQKSRAAAFDSRVEHVADRRRAQTGTPPAFGRGQPFGLKWSQPPAGGWASIEGGGTADANQLQNSSKLSALRAGAGGGMLHHLNRIISTTRRGGGEAQIWAG